MLVKKEYSSIKITRIFLIIIGFWDTESKRDEFIRKCCRVYTVQAMFGAVITQIMEFLISRDNINDFTFWLCSCLPTILVIFKFSIFYIKRREVVDIIRYTKKHFWNNNYNEQEKEIMDASNRIAVFIIGLFMSLLYGVIFCYLITPIIENRSRSKSERKFPFNGIAAFFGSESTKSPNYEIMFTIEVMPMFHIGILFGCFDNLLLLLTSFLIGQFKILHHRLKNISNIRNFNSEQSRVEISDKLKDLVEFHKSLIIYVSYLEEIFTVILFCQLLMSAILICVAGIQGFLVKSSAIKAMIFKFHVSAGFFQLLIITWSANNIILESNAIAYYAYDIVWYCFPHDKYGKLIRHGVKTIIMRSYRSSSLSAAGFFPVSIASFMSVLSTTLSYFTLLRQFL